MLNRLRVITTTPGAVGAGWSSRYAYNAANQRTRRAEADNSYWVYEYDSLGQVVSGKRYWSDGSPVAGQQFEYAYDDIGNRTSSKEGGNESGNGLRSSAYTRNSLNQYTQRTNAPFADVQGVATASASVTVNGGSAVRKGEYFRREIPISNASGPVATTTTVQATSGGSSTTTTGTLLNPPSTQAFTYDPDGNLLLDGLWVYTWDGENRLLSVESTNTLAAGNRRKVSWEYDPAGRRVRQTTAGWNGGTWTNATDLKLLYDGWACIAELNATNNALIQSYAWGLDLSGTPTGAGGVGGLLWMRPNGGAPHFAAYDGNGNVTGLTDGSTGTESARYEYDPFGATLRLTGTGTIAKDNPFRFSTKRAEAETSLVLYEYRVYNATLGRWPSRDTIEEKGGLNIYAFADNGPIEYFDPLGLHVFTVDVTAKSWIAEPITAGWVTGMNPLNYPNLLYAVGLVELLTSDNVIDDAVDGRYRFLSQKTFSIDCCGSYMQSHNFSSLFTDVGLEGGVFIPEVVVTEDRAYKATDASVRFTWMVKGRPHPLAEPTLMNPVMHRTSVYIWHRILGSIRCVNGKPVVSLKMLNSQFPSADAFYRIDGGPLTRAAAYAQGAMARLWDSDFVDPTLVK